GTVWCWGDNGFEQLGVGGTAPRSTPVQVPFLSGAVVSAVAAGGEHTCALLANGTVECWGDGSLGQLGNGKGGQTFEPGPTSPLSANAGVGAVQLVAGIGFKC